VEYKIAWFTEGGWEGKVPRNHPNMRNDMAWMNALDVVHHPIVHLPSIKDGEYDIGIITIPKTNIDKLMQFDIMGEIKRVCKKVGTMQEGPHWYFQDYTMEQQIWFYNTLTELDFIWCHNEIDKKYYKGLTDKKCYVNPTLMLEDEIKPHTFDIDNRSGVMIGGNMCRWYGGFDSYIVAQEFDEKIYAPSMGRKIEREDEMDINHLPYMTWVDWINNLSKYKYGVHLMPTWAAGTFTLNCAYHGIPCIGYKGLDTQEQLHPSLSVDYGDLNEAKILAKKLRDDNEFYKKCSGECKTIYKKSHFTENKYIYIIKDILKKVMGDN
tara:strand:+ start:16896 stop:17864 length:969 start_codon:yes stop_codon:yes gene_type:complete